MGFLKKNWYVSLGGGWCGNLFIYLLFRLFDMSDFSIQEITAGTKLTCHWKVRDQIDTIERLETKLKYDVNDKDQICSLPKLFFIIS